MSQLNPQPTPLKLAKSFGLILATVAVCAAVIYYRRPLLTAVRGSEDCGKLQRGAGETEVRARNRAAVACMLRNFSTCSPSRVKITNSSEGTTGSDNFEMKITISQRDGDDCWLEVEERSDVHDRRSDTGAKRCRRLEAAEAESALAGRLSSDEGPEDLRPGDCAGEGVDPPDPAAAPPASE